MNGRQPLLRKIMVTLLLTLFVFAIASTGAVEAYTTRFAGSTTTRVIARSQPFAFSNPVPLVPVPQSAPSEPALLQTTLSQPAYLSPSGNIVLNAQERLLLDLVNKERISRGLRPLQLDARLTRLARMKSQDMIDNRYFAHLSPTYGRAGDMIRSAGIPFVLAAENIGVGGNIRTIFNAFMQSSGHRNKIIGPRYTLTGVGVIYQRGRGYLVTQLFVAPR